MGNFDFICSDCEHGEGGYDSRDYFGAPVRISVRRKNGAPVILPGTYTGYGSVEACGQTFYLDQFAEYFAGWGYDRGVEKIPNYVAEDVWCEACMYGCIITSVAEWDLSEFYTVEEYDTNGGYTKPKAAPPAPPAPAAPAAPAPVAAAPKPKAAAKPKPVKAKLKKADLEALLKDKEAELTALKAENDALKVREARFKQMEAIFAKTNEQNEALRKALKTVQRACCDVGIY